MLCFQNLFNFRSKIYNFSIIKYFRRKSIEKRFPFLNKDLGMNAAFVKVYLSKNEASIIRKDIDVERFYYQEGDQMNLQMPLFRDTKNEFNIDNYGPIKIPKDSCFVIGDNRHQSDDSRYWGFVAKSNIKGVVVTKIDFLSWIYRKLGI